MGEGKNPGTEHLIKLGLEAKLGQKLINTIIDRTKNALSKWKILAKNCGVSQANIELIDKEL
jgi:serine/threonine-protein kinase HipA